jgi:hypothetical protein
LNQATAPLVLYAERPGGLRPAGRTGQQLPVLEAAVPGAFTGAC